MAKKKVSNPSHSHEQNGTMLHDSSAALQIQNLKNLNALLLKETTQRRQQIDSLHSELHHSAMTSDASLAFDLQNAVISVFVKTQLNEINLRLHTLLRDTDREAAALRSELTGLTARLQTETTALAQERDGLVREAKRFEETSNRERKLREEAQELLSQTQTHIAQLKAERDSALKCSQDSAVAIETLKQEIQVVNRDKREVEKRNDAQEKKIAALEVDLRQLDESSKKEQEFMRAKVLQLEGNLGVALEKEDEMKMEIGALLEENKKVEKSVEILEEEKTSVGEALDLVKKELENKQQELDGVVRVRTEIEQVKVNLENEIVELRGQVEDLKECCRKFEEENAKLVLQVNSYRDAVNEAVVEKERVKKVVDEKRKEVEKLQLDIAGLEETVAKSEGELGDVRREREKLVEKEKTLEGNVSVLRKENEALESMVVEMQKENEELKGKVEVWCSNSNKALELLKTTAAAIVCQNKYKDRDGVEVASNNVEPYTHELDSIKKAFKSKEEIVDEMKLQLASLNKSVAEAHKSKTLWTVISSATTIFAAVLAAYVARARST